MKFSIVFGLGVAIAACVCNSALAVESAVWDIDIIPGSFPNSINLEGEGVLPVAILTADDFDALNVNIATLLFGDPVLLGSGGTAVSPLSSAIEDVNGNGFLDLSLMFSITEMVGFDALGPDTIEGLLTGETFDGTPYAGTDSIHIIPEPATLTLVALALLGLLAHGRRRRRA